jgi:hypothetical protein
MKKLFLYILAVVFSFAHQSCLKDKTTMTYTIFTPVYKEKSEVYANMISNTPRQIKSPGKIFLYDNYIFLNEIDKGVHIIDNSDPSNPQVKAFINIPGNLDIAVKGNTLYADLYADMVVIDITNPLQAKFVKYIGNIFHHRSYQNGFVADSSRVIVEWLRKDTTVDLKSRINFGYCGTGLLASSFADAGSAAAPRPPGVAGSMARFSIVNDHMYAVNTYQLRSFDISTALNPQELSTVNLGWDIETIYPFANKLFIGSQGGMFIYDIGNPASPVAQGQFSHARACDPVIADNTTAYVTLRDGTPCFGFNNQLDVVDVSNLSAPALLKSYQMTNPHGLSKDGNNLFICDGKAGLKVYDASDPLHLDLKQHVTGIETYDAIAWNGNLLVVAKDGLYQYSYTGTGEIHQRSKISVHK